MLLARATRKRSQRGLEWCLACLYQTGMGCWQSCRGQRAMCWLAEDMRALPAIRPGRSIALETRRRNERETGATLGEKPFNLFWEEGFGAQLCQKVFVKLLSCAFSTSLLKRRMKLPSKLLELRRIHDACGSRPPPQCWALVGRGFSYNVTLLAGKLWFGTLMRTHILLATAVDSKTATCLVPTSARDHSLTKTQMSQLFCVFLCAVSCHAN